MKVTNWLSKFKRTSLKRRGRVLASLAAAGVAGVGTLAQADTTTTLTGLTAPGNVDVPQTHGDNAEVDLTWDSDFDQYGTLNYAGGWNGRGDVYQMEYTYQDITFAPIGNRTQVTINQLFLDEWAGGGNTSSAWWVKTPRGEVIASGVWDLKNNANDPADDGGRDLITINAVGRPTQTLTLTFENFDSLSGGGYDSYLAMDNLTFSTTIVPEPATAVMAWLGVGGLGALAMRRKRN
jgi:uncharacterized protein (TIGR03382 family)